MSYHVSTTVTDGSDAVKIKRAYQIGHDIPGLHLDFDHTSFVGITVTAFYFGEVIIKFSNTRISHMVL
jgi:hypothetical protein